MSASEIPVLVTYPKCWYGYGYTGYTTNVSLLCMLIFLHADPRFFYPLPILIIICTREYGLVFCSMNVNGIS